MATYYDLHIDEGPKISFISARIMEIGQIAQVVEGGFTGVPIIRVYDQYVSLSDPTTTWCNPDFKVRLLPKGSKVTLTVA